MVWGSGSALGVLAVLGYGVFVCGAALLWANRIDFAVWVNDEFGAVRRTVIRHAVTMNGHGLREELMFKAAPSGFIRRLARHSRRRINCGTMLLSVGLLLLFLDFIV